MTEEQKTERHFFALVIMTLLCFLVTFLGIVGFIRGVIEHHDYEDIYNYSKAFAILGGFIIYFLYLRKIYGKNQTLKVIYMCFCFSLLTFLFTFYLTLLELKDYDKTLTNTFGSWRNASFIFLIYSSVVVFFVPFIKENDMQYKYMTMNTQSCITLILYLILFILFGIW